MFVGGAGQRDIDVAAVDENALQRAAGVHINVERIRTNRRKVGEICADGQLGGGGFGGRRRSACGRSAPCERGLGGVGGRSEAGGRGVPVHIAGRSLSRQDRWPKK